MMSEERIREIELSLKEAELNARNAQQDANQEIILGEKEKSMIQEQLDLGEELERIDHLLKGDILKDGGWKPAENKDMIILSEYGVHLIRNTIVWYLNKNTLLSNYDDKTINSKMEDFATDLCDTIFMEYEKIFQYPTLEECKDVLKDRIKKKQELKEFSIELVKGRKATSEESKEIEDKILIQIEPIIEKELNKIKEQTIKNKLKRFLLIMREVQDAVHSTYLRAWKGQERTTLRQHITISENKGGYNLQPQNQSFGPLAFLRRR